MTSVLLAACASKPVAKSENVANKNTKTLAQEKQLREKEEIFQDQKDKNQILKAKSHLNSSLKIAAVPQKKGLQITPESNSTARNDKELYAELAGAYDRNNEIAFFPRFQRFMQKYAASPLADDAVYLAGLMSLSNKNYGPALKYFNQVLKKYPTSNKASASLFAKGVALKKMNLNDESRKVFAQVRRAYPGSPEALRAETELKLLAR